MKRSAFAAVERLESREMFSAADPVGGTSEIELPINIVQLNFPAVVHSNQIERGSIVLQTENYSDFIPLPGPLTFQVYVLSYNNVYAGLGALATHRKPIKPGEAVRTVLRLSLQKDALPIGTYQILVSASAPDNNQVQVGSTQSQFYTFDVSGPSPEIAANVVKSTIPTMIRAGQSPHGFVTVALSNNGDADWQGVGDLEVGLEGAEVFADQKRYLRIKSGKTVYVRLNVGRSQPVWPPGVTYSMILFSDPPQFLLTPTVFGTMSVT